MELVGLTVGMFVWGWAVRFKMIKIDNKRHRRKRRKLTHWHGVSYR